MTQSGTYEVQVFIDGCWYRDDVVVFDVNELFLDAPVTQCETESNTIVIPFEEATSYLWDDGTEEQFRDIDNSGIYGFTITDTYGCVHDGELDVEIIPNKAPVYIPNTFTPNGDGINDLFIPVVSNLDEYTFTVYDRWGNELFTTSDPEQGWQGNQGGTSEYYSADNIYSYKIKYRSLCSTERIEEVGYVTIIR